MGILDLLARLCGLRCSGDIFLAIILSNEVSRVAVSFFLDTNRICSQVCDQANGSQSLNIDTFIQLLCEAHRLLR